MDVVQTLERRCTDVGTTLYRRCTDVGTTLYRRCTDVVQTLERRCVRTGLLLTWNDQSQIPSQYAETELILHFALVKTMILWGDFVNHEVVT